MDNIYTLDEVCERYRITRPTWNKMTRKNPVPSFVVGNRIWIREEDLIAWEKSNATTANKPRRGGRRPNSPVGKPKEGGDLRQGAGEVQLPE